MEKIRYKGQVYVRMDDEFTSTEKQAIQKGVGHLKDALAALQKAHKAFIQVGALSEAAYDDVDDAKRICDKVMRQVNQAMRG